MVFVLCCLFSSSMLKWRVFQLGGNSACVSLNFNKTWKPSSTTANPAIEAHFTMGHALLFERDAGLSMAVEIAIGMKEYTMEEL